MSLSCVKVVDYSTVTVPLVELAGTSTDNSVNGRIKEELIKIKGPVICTGVGGSSVVSEYASKVLNQKNGIVADCLEMRDLNYKNLDGYSSVLACSYSGNNYGVETAFRNNLEKYLLSTGEIPGIHNLTYSSGFHKEDSFISLGATLMPYLLTFVLSVTFR